MFGLSRSFSYAIVPALLGLAASCSKESKDSSGSTQPAPTTTTVTAPRDATPDGPPPQEWYRVVLGEKQGTAIPVFLQIPPSGTEAFIATGPDRIRGTLTSRPPKLEVTFDIYHTRITAADAGGGKLDGAFESKSGSWGAASLSFTAEPIAKPDATARFPASPGGPDAEGIWKVQLSDQLGKLTIKHGEQPAEVTATIRFQSGNMAFLAGTQDGRTVRLSAFDGTSPYLLTAELDAANKSLKGNWTAGQGLDWKETFTGKRTADFELKLQPKLVGKHPKLSVPQLTQAPYKGNPVIVEVGGSWCAACGNAAGMLKQLRTKYASQNLQVLMLAYEFTDDPAYNKSQAEVFKHKYDVPWEIVPVDGGLDKYNDILPKEVQGIDASGFPITIFVNRDGTIEDFHSGFPPDAWGDVHTQAAADYERLTAAIAASKPAP